MSLTRNVANGKRANASLPTLAGACAIPATNHCGCSARIKLNDVRQMAGLWLYRPVVGMHNPEPPRPQIGGTLEAPRD